MLVWSDKMRSLWRNHCWSVLLDDARTNRVQSVYFGFPLECIRTEVICEGLADFDAVSSHPMYGTLTPQEKVLCYLYLNFPSHFFASFAAFDSLRAEIAEMSGPNKRLLFFDIGCGPATSALAFLDLRERRRFDYFGIDVSQAMRDKAKELLLGAKDCGLARPAMYARFGPTWNDARLDRIPACSQVIVNCSYFFASQSLADSDIESLAEFLSRLASLDAVERILLVQTNSTKDRLNRRFVQLSNRLKRTPNCAEQTILYGTKRSAPAKSTTFRFDSLMLKG